MHHLVVSMRSPGLGVLRAAAGVRDICEPSRLHQTRGRGASLAGAGRHAVEPLTSAFELDTECGAIADGHLLFGVLVGLSVVRVAQIVHGVDERFVAQLQFLLDLGEHRRADGVKAEVHVKHIEPMVVFPDPLRIEHQGRPPAAGHLAAVGGDRIAKARHCIESAGI